MVVIGAGRQPLPLPTGMLMKSGLRVMGSRNCSQDAGQSWERVPVRWRGAVRVNVAAGAAA